MSDTKEGMSEQGSCYTVGISGDNQARDMLVERGGKPHIITVATPEHIRIIEEYNQGFDEEVALDDISMPVSDVSDENNVCELIANTPDSVLSRYWIEQSDDF